MKDLVTALSNFMARDVLFILGGTCLIVSLLYSFNQLPDEGFATPYYVIGAGIAYVIGYAVQEFFSLAGISTTATYFEAPRIAQWLYHRLEQRPWVQPEPFDPDAVRAKIDTGASPRTLDLLERTVALMQVGTTVGSCVILSAFPLIIRAFWTSDQSSSAFHATVGILALLFGLGLLGLGWVKACQRMRCMAHLDSQLTLPTVAAQEPQNDDDSKS